tara:strand:+ start:488 stop:790 length:303 start_codon:yes stop_codon:yes gene_type:complete
MVVPLHFLLPLPLEVEAVALLPLVKCQVDREVPVVVVELMVRAEEHNPVVLETLHLLVLLRVTPVALPQVPVLHGPVVPVVVLVQRAEATLRAVLALLQA